MHGASLKAWMALPSFWISLREGEAVCLRPKYGLGRRWTLDQCISPPWRNFSDRWALSLAAVHCSWMCRSESTTILTSGGKTDRDDIGEASPQIKYTRTGGLQPLGVGSGAVVS